MAARMANIDKAGLHVTLGRDHSALQPGWPAKVSPVGKKSNDGQNDVKSIKEHSAAENTEDLNLLRHKLNRLLKTDNRQLDIAIDPESGLAVFKVIDTESGEVVTEIPASSGTAAETVAIIRRGVLFDSK